MPRARRQLVSTAQAISLFAEHHIVAVRRRRGGEITQVKHAALGWMPVKDYYGLQKAHDFLPLIEKIVEGGYRINVAIYGTAIEVLGFTLPIGLALASAAVFDLFTTDAMTDPQRFVKALFKVAGPFGALLQLGESIIPARGNLTVHVRPTSGTAIEEGISGAVVSVKRSPFGIARDQTTGSNGTVVFNVEHNPIGDSICEVRYLDFPIQRSTFNVPPDAELTFTFPD